MRIQLFFCASLLLLMLLPGITDAQFLGWNFVNIEDDLRESGANPDMVVEDNGTIHLSYWQRDEDKLIYAFRGPNDNSWTREYVDINGLNGYKSSIALSANGTPAIAYQENINQIVQMRFASRAGTNSWTVEAIPGDVTRGWGGYGPNASITEKERVVHTVDLLFDEIDKPQIIFFDGWMDIDAFPACTRNSQYGFRLHQAYRVGNTWEERDLGIVSDINLSCGTNSAPDTLPTGDRYGEYANLMLRSDGRLEIFCLSRFNNRIVRFQNLLPSVDTVWTFGEVDSLFRNLDSASFFWSKRFYTFEGIAATISEDEATHLSYTSSLFYGENFCCTSFTNDLVYARITNTDTFFHNFGTQTYRNHTAIRTRGGSDSVFIAYSDLSRQQFLLQATADSGSTWVLDTIMEGIGIGISPMEIVGDSLHVLIYNAQVEDLTLARRHVDGGPWRYELINTSENKGFYYDGTVRPSGGDTTAQMAYIDGFKSEMYYATGTKNTNWTWSITPIDTGTGQLKSVTMALSTSEEPVLAYGGGLNGDLRLATLSNGTWQYEIVDSGVAVGFTDIEVSALDTVHIVYYDDNVNCLRYASRHLTGTTWNYDVIDCANQPVGEYPSLQLDAQGAPHVAYYDDARLALMYAEQNPGTRAWDIDSVNGSAASALGKFASLKFNASGRPAIAYLDEQATSVFLSEKNAAGTWTHELVDSVPIVTIGRPIRLAFDQFGKAWIAYNFFTNFDKVKLMRRENGTFNEVGVSSAGQIANAFAFEIIGDDLYILGKKNQLGNTGVAMIYADNGLFVKAEDPDDLQQVAQISNYPNPFTGSTTIKLELTRAQSLNLKVYDVYGKQVGDLLAGEKLGAGTHEFEFSGDHLGPGVYIYLLENDRSRIVKRMVLTR
ncbi:MAG: T9SS type A sorting domain-containing protein [Bacteroidota bacterium]